MTGVGGAIRRAAVKAGVLTLAAGVSLQLWAVADRVVELVWQSYRFSELVPLTAGRGTFVMFSVLSLAGSAASWALSVAARERGWITFSRVVAVLYFAGWLTWAGMIASPLAGFVR